MGCSSQNGASSGKPGSGTLPRASTRNQAAGTESLRSHSGLGPDLLQRQGGISGVSPVFQYSGAGLLFGPAVHSRSQKVCQVWELRKVSQGPWPWACTS